MSDWRKLINYTLLPTDKAMQVRERFEKTFIMTPSEYEAYYLRQFKTPPSNAKELVPDINTCIYWGKMKDSEQKLDFSPDAKDSQSDEEEMNRLCFILRT